MTDFNPVFGHQTRYGVGASAPSTKAIELTQCGLVGTEQNVRNQGMRGTRTQIKTGIRRGLRAVQGAITLEPRPDELAFFLPFILGGTPVSANYPLAEALSSFMLDADTSTKVYRYTGIYVNRATFRSSAGQPLSLTMECIALEWDDDSITFPSIGGTYSTQSPFVHSDLAFNIDLGSGDVLYLPQDVTLTVDNRLAQIYRNSLSPSFVKPGDRMITMGFTLGNSVDEQVLWELGSTEDANITAKWDQGTPAVSLQFELPASQAPRETPRVNGRPVEVNRNFQFTARASAALGELTTTLDSTP